MEDVVKEESLPEEKVEVENEKEIRKPKRKIWTSRRIASVAIFGAISTILYCVPFLKFSVPFFPSFLEFHFDEIPAFIAGFAYGPLTAFLILLVKTIIKLPMTSTVCVGELADLIYSCAFIIPAALFYKKKRTLKGAMLGFIIGFVSQVLVSGLCNALFMIDFYLYLYSFLTPETLLAMCQKINPNVKDIHFSLVVLLVVPFNILKNLIVTFVTVVVYKSIHRLIEKAHA